MFVSTISVGFTWYPCSSYDTLIFETFPAPIRGAAQSYDVHRIKRLY